MTDEEALALNSIYFHALYGDDDPGPEELPEEYRPLPLEEAAARLASGQRSALRHRAAARLLASPRRPAMDPAHPFNRALDLLLPKAVPLSSITPPLMGTAPPERQFGGYLRMLNAAETDLPCERTEPDTTVDFDPNTSMISGRSTMRVRRPLAELRALLDPQEWDRVLPAHFVQSCVADCPNGTCEIDPKTYDATCAAAPPATGSDWAAILFEHFRLNIGKVVKLVEFKNLLDVTSEQTPTGHRFTYTLRSVLYGRIAVAEQVGNGLDHDDGYIELSEEADGWVALTATKDFRLAGWKHNKVLNWWTSITIRTTLDSAYEAVCTDLDP